MEQTGSGGLNNSPGTNATGADFNVRRTAIPGNRPDSLQVRQPAATGLVMGVADIISGRGAFATNFTISGHNKYLLKKIQFSITANNTLTPEKIKLFSQYRREQSARPKPQPVSHPNGSD
jgi:hypothetical protein